MNRSNESWTARDLEKLVEDTLRSSDQLKNSIRLVQFERAIIGPNQDDVIVSVYLSLRHFKPDETVEKVGMKGKVEYVVRDHTVVYPQAILDEVTGLVKDEFISDLVSEEDVDD